MDDVRQITESYKILKCKVQYLKNYLEHIDAIYKKTSELLFRATQIPRDTYWNDVNITNMVECGERQRVLFDEMCSLHSVTIFQDLENLIEQINEEIKIIDTDLSDIIKENNIKVLDLENAKKNHIESWLKNKDPWITDIRIKVAIKNAFTIKEANDIKIYSKLKMYNDKLSNTLEMYHQILKNFLKLQKKLFNNLLETTNLRIGTNEEAEYFYDVIGESSKEKRECKIADAYEGIIEGISVELLKHKITIFKNIEPLKYTLCKLKKGITGEWSLLFVVITTSRHMHFFDFWSMKNILEKYDSLLGKLKHNVSRGLVSIFDSKKNCITFIDERSISMLAEEILTNIDKIIGNICLSINLNEKKTKIDKEKFIITIDDKNQSGISSLFCMNMMRVKTFTLTKCFELYFAAIQKDIKDRCDDVQDDCKINKFQDEFEESNKVDMSIKTVNINILEENPWT